MSWIVVNVTDGVARPVESRVVKAATPKEWFYEMADYWEILLDTDHLKVRRVRQSGHVQLWVQSS